MANWANVQRIGDPLAPGWQDQNLTWIEPVPGQKWQVYKPAAQAFTGLLSDLYAQGYKPTSSGGFNYRTIRGGDKLSQHAFGTAIDINAADNPRVGQGQAVVTNLPANTGELAKKYGLEWGGNWSRPDAMHFEFTGGGMPSTMMASAGTLAPAGGKPASSIAALFNPAPAVAGGMPMGAPASIGDLALLFGQQQAQRQQQKQDEQDAEMERKRALFSADSLAGLFGAA